jgi:hypothetical protein
MIKNKSRGVKSALLSCVILASVVTPSFVGATVMADSSQNIVSQTGTHYANNESQFDYLTEYVDVKDNKFVLNIPADVPMSDADIATVRVILAESNERIQEANLTIDEDTLTAKTQTRFTRGFGKNHVEFHWNYARVWLSKGTIHNIGRGAAFAGIWIPEPIVSKVCASLGFVASLTPNGVWFDYNYSGGILLGRFGWQ